MPQTQHMKPGLLPMRAPVCSSAARFLMHGAQCTDSVLARVTSGPSVTLVPALQGAAQSLRPRGLWLGAGNCPVPPEPVLKPLLSSLLSWRRGGAPGSHGIVWQPRGMGAGCAKPVLAWSTRAVRCWLPGWPGAHTSGYRQGSELAPGRRRPAQRGKEQRGVGTWMADRREGSGGARSDSELTGTPPRCRLLRDAAGR